MSGYVGATFDIHRVYVDMNIEYGYCFSAGGDRAIDVLKIKGAEKADEAARALESAGFKRQRIAPPRVKRLV